MVAHSAVLSCAAAVWNSGAVPVRDRIVPAHRDGPVPACAGWRGRPESGAPRLRACRGSRMPRDRPRLLQSVDQFHRAVMLNEEPRGDFPDGRLSRPREGLGRQAELVLLGLDAVFFRGGLAEMKELPDLPAKFGQIAIAIQRQVAPLLHICILSRHDLAATIPRMESGTAEARTAGVCRAHAFNRSQKAVGKNSKNWKEWRGNDGARTRDLRRDRPNVSRIFGLYAFGSKRFADSVREPFFRCYSTCYSSPFTSFSS